MKRFAVGLAMLAATTVGHSDPLRADDLADCQSSNPDRVIAGCTGLLEAGRLKPFYQAHAYNSRGVAFHNKREFDRAVADFDRAIEINPEHDQAYNNRALVYLTQRRYVRAVADLDTAITLNPERWQAYVNRGNAYQGMGLFEQAVADYTAALELSPGEPWALNNRAYAYSHSGEQERAVADIDAALALEPGNARMHHSLGEILFYAGQPEKATEAWQAACRLASDDVTRMWQRNLAVRGHYAGAVDGICDDKLIEAFRSCAREKCFLHS